MRVMLRSSPGRAWSPWQSVASATMALVGSAAAQPIPPNERRPDLHVVVRDYTHAAFQSHAYYPAWSDNSNSTGDNPDGKLHQFDLFTAKVVIG